MDFCKRASFKLFPEGGNRRCTVYLVRKVIPNLGSIKGKTMTNCFTECLGRSGIEELPGIGCQSDYDWHCRSS